MKLSSTLLITILATSFPTSASASHLRVALTEDDAANLERRRGPTPEPDNGGGDSDGGRDGKNKSKKHGQGMITVHGMTSHPKKSDVTIIGQTLVKAYNSIHPNSEWTMKNFQDTWVQVFEEENDPPSALGATDTVAVSKQGLKHDRLGAEPDWDLKDLWGVFGGYWSCESKEFTGGHSSRLMSALDMELIQDRIGSSAVGDKLCDILLDSEMEIFKQVYDCAVSAKPAELAIVEFMRKQNEGASATAITSL